MLRHSHTQLVYNFHRKTVEAASDIVGIMGKTRFADISSDDIMRRHRHEVRTLSELFPPVEEGCLLHGEGPERLQDIWNGKVGSRRWIY